MKKNVFWLAAMAAAVSLTGCSVDEVVEKAEVRNIGFDAFANKSSRAENKLAASGHSDFSVWGGYDLTGTPVYPFSNTKISWSEPSTSWTYDNPVPWVDDKNYVFGAVAPYKASYGESAFNYTNGTYTLGEITLDNTEANQIDYLTATKVDRNSSTKDAVGFTFNHIVSNIIFNFQPKITNDADKTTAWTSPVQIIIKNITLSNVLTNKKYENNTWSAATSPNTSGSFVTTLSSDNITTYEPAGPEGTPARVLTPLENKFSWFVVPQDNTDDAPNRTLTLTFDIKTKDASGAYNVVAKTGATASVDIDTEWATNTQYTYTVYIGTDVLGTNAFITFDVTSVAGWDNSSPAEDDINVTPSTGD